MTPAEMQRSMPPPSQLLPEQQTRIIIWTALIGGAIQLLLVVGGIFAAVKFGYL